MTYGPTTPAARTALYRAFCADGRLIYVGIARNAIGRFGGHASESAWWPEVATITIEWHPDRATAKAAETAAIRAERPLYNVAKATDRVADVPDSRWKHGRPAKWQPKPQPERKYKPETRGVAMPVDLWDRFTFCYRYTRTYKADMSAMLGWYLREPDCKLPRRIPAEMTRKPEPCSSATRQVPISDSDWAQLGALHAHFRGRVIRQLIAWYVREPKAMLPERPPIERIEAARRGDVAPLFVPERIPPRRRIVAA